MDYFSVVGVTSDILKGLLSLSLKEAFDICFSIKNISLASPKEIEDDPQCSVRLSLLLYQIVENVYIRNHIMENLVTVENKYPPLTLYNLIIKKCSLKSNPLSSMGFS